MEVSEIIRNKFDDDDDDDTDIVSECGKLKNTDYMNNFKHRLSQHLRVMNMDYELCVINYSMCVSVLPIHNSS